MFKFLTRRGFLLNALVALALFILLCIGILSALESITSHGEYSNVPEVIGMSLEDATAALEQKGFKVEIQDSVWMADMKPMAVVKQTPDPNAVVKAKRKVFLTVNRQQPPLVEMPNLVGFTFRNANIFITQMGLELGDTSRKPDIAKDAVLEQKYNGRHIAPGTRIFVGSQIDFVLGSGISDIEIEVPDLFGMRYSDALKSLHSSGLNVGAIVADFDVKDTASSFVYKQNPEKKKKDEEGRTVTNRIKIGQAIDLFLRREAPLQREEEPDENSVTNETEQQDDPK